MLQDSQQDIVTGFTVGLIRGLLSGARLGSDDFEQPDTDVQEDIEVALIQMKGDTVQRVREALGTGFMAFVRRDLGVGQETSCCTTDPPTPTPALI